ncbi:cinnamyl alcohol dehydrogenase [Yamadazyma tenuis]|uniref:NADPH-dependent alcohol dehydrogenase n=1 Tax=Candida tenuis (strain ATCC 10573 / BCRC 21748 / CBS 615 / JCM 9827 / NBRC 10315 / NRRL Y-1498 / VKM Y-70) TaxID=590646 RepID=G3B119_CANTC|nr:NADPH-dependent alcohol dehydrogenase [Yamadazyma tenuis ATCC 10573]EGV64859.1 NADPH-dependent alcohol dehydrogenase [Yamadazyma tenuis ATCC 10573]WEJ97655.1 cinnamyl alcohol dehydrogenase [Yamadazyma tenuis]
MSYQGFAIHDTTKYNEAKKITFKARTVGDYDVVIKVDHCGICGTDVHTATGGWGGPILPVIPGHEIIGSVTKIGDKVTLFKVGDRVGVGAQVDACWSCKACDMGEETYCKDVIDTYNSTKNGEVIYGGYSNYVSANEQFAFGVPKQLDKAEAAPLFCAGITVFAPLKRAITKPGMKVGIVGIGGLGHMAIQFAAALGAEVYAMSRGDSKKEDSLKMGAKHYIDTTKENWAAPYKMEFDFILSCANSNKGFTGDYFSCLTVYGNYVSAGLPETPFELKAQHFIGNGASFGSSHLGNRKEMLEMLELAAKNNILPWTEVLPISEENVKLGLTKTYKGDVRYRVALTDYAAAFD